MSKTLKVRISLVLLLSLASVLLVATTWAPSDIVCPVCHTKNSFSEIMSYGSYIYGWPSKFQFIFWPLTDGNSLYSCKQCHLTLFMWDFKEVPPGKVEDLRHVLAGIHTDKDYAKYTEIPMSQRLEIAEKVYTKLDKDDDFWCMFYRVKGYHLAREKKTIEAGVARGKALELARKMLDDPARAGEKKELFLISGAMHHFLGDDNSAKGDFEASLAAAYESKKLTEEQNKNMNDNLNGLAKEYLERIGKKSVPADDGTDKP